VICVVIICDPVNLGFHETAVTSEGFFPGFWAFVSYGRERAYEIACYFVNVPNELRNKGDEFYFKQKDCEERVEGMLATCSSLRLGVTRTAHNLRPGFIGCSSRFLPSSRLAKSHAQQCLRVISR
jgi:hypothetical protein